MSETTGASGGRVAVVTGALGFVGGAVAAALTRQGTRVRAVDLRLRDHGANDRNLAAARATGLLDFSEGDVRDGALVASLCEGASLVVHAAAHVSHTAGVEDPLIDLEHNVRGTLVLLDAVRRHAAPDARVLYASTRGVYGAPTELPVRESHPCAPRGMHEWSKLAAEEALRTFGRLHGVRGAVLRLTNLYGPGAQIRSPSFGVVNWWLGRALQGEPVPVFGEGLVRRDLVYIDDAVDAVLRAAEAPLERGEVRACNVGGERSHSLREIADAVVRAAGSGRVELRPYTDARKAMEVGDFASDLATARAWLGWAPATPLEEGLERAARFYREHLREYL